MIFYPLLRIRTCAYQGVHRGGSRAAATSTMEVIVNAFQPLTMITKRSILDVAAALDSPLGKKC